MGSILDSHWNERLPATKNFIHIFRQAKGHGSVTLFYLKTTRQRTIKVLKIEKSGGRVPVLGS